MRWTLIAVLLVGCAAGGDRTLERVEMPFRPGRRVDRLLVLIHGARDHLRSFEKNGFMEELAERAIELDAVAIDPRYPSAQKLAEHLHDDLILPKRQEGYRQIYVLAVGEGAQGAIAFARRYAGEPNGLILIAPYLGADPLVDEINAEGGLDQWRPKPPLEDVELVWQWLQGYGNGAPRPPLELMWGEKDLSSVQLTTLEEVLPEERVHRIEGGHEWSTWRKLWADLLDRDPFGWIDQK